MSEKIFVTGGAGFIGSHVIEHHLKKGDEVWAVDNLVTGQKKNLNDHSKLRFDEGELISYPHLQEAVEWADRVYHLAAFLGMFRVVEDPIATLSCNISTTETILKAVGASQKKPKFLFTSSSGVYFRSHCTDGCHEELDLAIPSGKCYHECYPLSKMVCEVLTLRYAEKMGFSAIIVRPFNTIGVRQTGKYGMVVPRLIGQALKGEPLTVFGDGKQTRSFINVHDSVEAMDLLFDYPESFGQIYNVGNPHEVQILDLAHLILERTKSASPIKFIPYREVYGEDFEDVRKRRPSIKKLQDLTGFEPKWVLEQTIDEIITSYRALLQSSSQ
ncbi:MAG: GDP-6-deoxy-D-mannose reductase [Chlamydiales bacterium]|nr:GDP-6-deoxy-D-mannose reductase [Chlamydiales bacterium]MCH9619308.1 GDP-6-deoxy-D-mannose reductase [Chlamydiales bacterium]MCH9622570.1 GDP-6-deoxy-D-mannose reductase [Chlamydiales bacterium]